MPLHTIEVSDRDEFILNYEKRWEDLRMLSKRITKQVLCCDLKDNEGGNEWQSRKQKFFIKNVFWIKWEQPILSLQKIIFSLFKMEWNGLLLWGYKMETINFNLLVEEIVFHYYWHWRKMNAFCENQDYI